MKDTKLSEFYKALSNPVRLKIFMHVASMSEGYAPKNKEGTCVGNLAKKLDIPQPTVSNHLKVLEECGLTKSIKEGTKSYQYVRKDASKYLLEHSQYIFEQAHKNPY